MEISISHESATAGRRLVAGLPFCMSTRERYVCRDLKKYHIAIVGATGAVGTELIGALQRRKFPVASIRPIGSSRSAGKTLSFGDEAVPVQSLHDDSFKDIDIAFFSAGSDISRKAVPIAKSAGAVVIDNSPAFRMD